MPVLPLLFCGTRRTFCATLAAKRGVPEPPLYPQYAPNMPPISTKCALFGRRQSAEPLRSTRRSSAKAAPHGLAALALSAPRARRIRAEVAPAPRRLSPPLRGLPGGRLDTPPGAQNNCYLISSKSICGAFQAACRAFFRFGNAFSKSLKN